MKLIMMNGGLGNQLFQYIFYRYLETKCGESCYIDDSAFFLPKVEHNGYEIERIFGIKNNLLSECFEKDIWDQIMKKRQEGVGICQQLLDKKLDIKMIAETSDFKFNGNVIYTPANKFNPSINIQKNNYYHGYWINKWWFENNKENILEKLKFPNLKTPANIEYAEQIKHTCSVSVHIRRGDFVTLHRELPSEYYFKAISMMKDKYPEAIYFIFSDDALWCKQNSEELGLDLIKDNIVFITGNKKETAYVDMQLMSMCKNMIIANSSFSYLAALLNRNENKFVISPNIGREI